LFGGIESDFSAYLSEIFFDVGEAEKDFVDEEEDGNEGEINSEVYSSADAD